MMEVYFVRRRFRKMLIVKLLILTAAVVADRIKDCEIYTDGKIELEEKFTVMPVERYAVDISHFSDDLSAAWSGAERVKTQLEGILPSVKEEPEEELGGKRQKYSVAEVKIPEDYFDEFKSTTTSTAAPSTSIAPSHAGSAADGQQEEQAAKEKTEGWTLFTKACEGINKYLEPAAPDDDVAMYEYVAAAENAEETTLLLPVSVGRFGLYSVGGELLFKAPIKSPIDVIRINKLGAVTLYVSNHTTQGLATPQAGKTYKTLCSKRPMFKLLKTGARQAALHQVTRAINEIAGFSDFVEYFNTQVNALKPVRRDVGTRELEITEVNLLDIINSHLAIIPRDRVEFKWTYWLKHIDELTEWFTEFAQTFKWEDGELIVTRGDALGVIDKSNKIAKGVPLRFRPEGRDVSDGKIILTARIPDKEGTETSIYKLTPFYEGKYRPNINYLTVLRTNGGGIKEAFATKKRPTKQRCDVGIKQKQENHAKQVTFSEEYCTGTTFEEDVDLRCGLGIVSALAKGLYDQLWDHCATEYVGRDDEYALVETCNKKQLVISVGKDTDVKMVCPGAANKPVTVVKPLSPEHGVIGLKPTCKHFIDDKPLEQELGKNVRWSESHITPIDEVGVEEGIDVKWDTYAAQTPIKYWSVQQWAIAIILPIGLASLSILTSVCIICSLYRRDSCWGSISYWFVGRLNQNLDRTMQHGRADDVPQRADSITGEEAVQLLAKRARRLNRAARALREERALTVIPAAADIFTDRRYEQGEGLSAYRQDDDGRRARVEEGRISFPIPRGLLN